MSIKGSQNNPFPFIFFPRTKSKRNKHSRWGLVWFCYLGGAGSGCQELCAFELGRPPIGPQLTPSPQQTIPHKPEFCELFVGHISLGFVGFVPFHQVPTAFAVQLDFPGLIATKPRASGAAVHLRGGVAGDLPAPGAPAALRHTLRAPRTKWPCQHQ